MRNLLIVLVALSLSLAACSGGAAPSAPGQSNPTADPQTNATDNPTSGQQSVNPDDPLGFGSAENTAVVVIGDQRFEFSNLYCVTMSGALGASSVGGDPTVDMTLPPGDWQTSGDEWDPPYVSVSLDDPYHTYSAGNAPDTRITAEQSQVDSYTSDGHHASGTATFIDVAAFMTDQNTASMSGSFEVTCGS